MASLFRDFSFDAVSPSLADHEAERAHMDCSPTSMPSSPQQLCSRPLTPPPCTMADLANILGEQSLFVNTTRSHHFPAAPPTPPSEVDTFPTHVRHHQGPRPTYCRASASIMRMQRQANSRLQCSASQVRDISKLVHMIQQQEQCTITNTTSPSTSTPPVSPTASDEGVDMDYDCPLRDTEPLYSRPLYRAGDRRDSRPRVTKNVRMRKRSGAEKDAKEKRKTC